MVNRRAAFITSKPLVVMGGTGMLGSQLVFLACADHFSSHIILHGSNEDRLKGLREEIYEAGFDGIDVTITLDADEACAQGGFLFYSRSVRSGAQTREALLLDNAPAAKETGIAISRSKNKMERVICVSNPSDLMGLSLLVHSRLRPEQVCSLSALDTTRYIKALSQALNCSPKDLSGVLTLGSHDQSMAVMRDTVKYCNRLTIDDLIQTNYLTEKGYKDVCDRVINGGIHIIKLRGHTAYQSPAYLGYQMLKASSTSLFQYPSSRYHHSSRYPYAFLSFPGIINDMGCFHDSLLLSQRDLERLDISYESVAHLRDTLIDNELLPPVEIWDDLLQKECGKVAIL